MFNQENSTRLKMEFESFEEALDQLQAQANKFNQKLKQDPEGEFIKSGRTLLTSDVTHQLSTDDNDEFQNFR